MSSCTHISTLVIPSPSPKWFQLLSLQLIALPSPGIPAYKQKTYSIDKTGVRRRNDNGQNRSRQNRLTQSHTTYWLHQQTTHWSWLQCIVQPKTTNVGVGSYWRKRIAMTTGQCQHHCIQIMYNYALLCNLVWSHTPKVSTSYTTQSVIMVTSMFARLQGFEYTLARVCKMTTSQNAAIKVLPATMEFPRTNCGLI